MPKSSRSCGITTRASTPGTGQLASSGSMLEVFKVEDIARLAAGPNNPSEQEKRVQGGCIRYLLMQRRHAGGGFRDDGGRDSGIAVEAARLISEHGIRDYHVAKRKAAERLGIAADTALRKTARYSRKRCAANTSACSMRTSSRADWRSCAKRRAKRLCFFRPLRSRPWSAPYSTAAPTATLRCAFITRRSRGRREFLGERRSTA